MIDAISQTRQWDYEQYDQSWSGTYSDLLQELHHHFTPDRQSYSRTFPKTANTLSRRLTHLKALLAEEGITTATERGKNARKLEIYKTEDAFEERKLTPNAITCGNCAEVMAGFPDECVDLTVTSPPYDELWTYNGYESDFDVFMAIAQQLYRITRTVGMVVWIKAYQTVDGSKSGSSFEQALYFKEIGFLLYDTMIYQKSGTSDPAQKRREGSCGKTTVRQQDGTLRERDIPNERKRKGPWNTFLVSSTTNHDHWRCQDLNTH